MYDCGKNSGAASPTPSRARLQRLQRTPTKRKIRQSKRRGLTAPWQNSIKLLFLVFVLCRLDATIMSRLRLCFFHRLLGFGSLLGASFGTLFFLFVENLLAAQQFEESLVGAVALVPVSANDARVPALAIAETRSHRVE